jgi:hypothetical protein
VRIENYPSEGGGITIDKDGEVWYLFRSMDNDLVIARDRDSALFGVTGEFTLETLGTSAPVPYMPFMPVMGLGDRRHTTFNAAPTTGEWARGDIVWNRDPSAGGFAAWACTTGGTPGTWKACLPIAA